MSPNSAYQNLLRRYAFYAPRYDRLWGKYTAATLDKAMEAAPLDGKSSLVDVACGTGLLVEMLLRRNPHLRVTGVDISPHMLEKARKRIAPLPGKVEWMIGHAESLPLESAQVDLLTCTNAFHLVQSPAAALAEFNRVLLPGGSLVIVDWCADSFDMRLRCAVLRIGDRQKRQVRRLHEMVALLEASGLAIDRAERFRARPLWDLLCVVAHKPDEIAGSVQSRKSKVAVA